MSSSTTLVPASLDLCPSLLLLSVDLAPWIWPLALLPDPGSAPSRDPLRSLDECWLGEPRFVVGRLCLSPSVVAKSLKIPVH